MTEGDAPNDLYKLAASFVQFTSRHVFLTGKAGTGKTTFLKDIVENSMKNTIVVAPTGVAAINAGGVTMHSFFQLPFGPFIPISTADADGDRVFNRATLFRKLRLGSNKKKLINELELLIIDEISMVRADMLDAMDAILRYVRKKPAEPFGGVQLLMIGDLFQLPPVVPETDWRILQAYYDSPYFFSAKALTDEGLVCIELEKVFRQRDNAFITLLNKVRTNTAGIDDIEKLNECYSGVSLKKKNVITLTTHNQKAHGINSTNLRQLKAGTFTFEAIIDGEFQEKSYPAEEVLELKEGAQVMFTKNDREDPRRYYNGKIGVVSAIAGDDIFVSCPEDESEIMVAQEEWKSIKYELNEESQEIEERELGTFRQYPLRLAWAITIHKSQGLTFEKAIIDAGASFSSGQVYVALSRLTSLEGLTLSSRITSDSIRTDARIVEFMLAQPSNYRDFQATLKKETATFIQKTLINSFDWQNLIQEFRDHTGSLQSAKIPVKDTAVQLAADWLQIIIEIQQVCDKFVVQLRQIFSKSAVDSVMLSERMDKAQAYFTERVEKQLLLPIREHMRQLQGKKGVKKYQKELLSLTGLLLAKISKLDQARLLANGLKHEADTQELLKQVSQKRQEDRQKVAGEMESVKPKKQEKGDSQRFSLQLFKQGKAIGEIASERGLAISTIQGHLSQFITTGDININELVEPDRVESISAAVAKLKNPNSSEIRQVLGGDYTYGEINATLKYLEVSRDQD